MIDLDAHAQLADATAELMRSYALATAQTMTTSACRGLALWSDMLRAPGPTSAPARSTASPFDAFWRMLPTSWLPPGSPSWPQTPWQTYWMSGGMPAFGWTPYTSAWTSPWSAGNWATWTSRYWPTWNCGIPVADPLAAPAAMASAMLQAAPYASYRSAGGHAAAQVIMLPEPAAAMPGLTMQAAITQMQTVLGFWRSALNC